MIITFIHLFRFRIIRFYRNLNRYYYNYTWNVIFVDSFPSIVGNKKMIKTNVPTGKSEMVNFFLLLVLCQFLLENGINIFSLTKQITTHVGSNCGGVVKI